VYSGETLIVIRPDAGPDPEPLRRFGFLSADGAFVVAVSLLVETFSERASTFSGVLLKMPNLFIWLLLVAG
jgi:hypothetical protein